jgi:hypothetical protein
MHQRFTGTSVFPNETGMSARSKSVSSHNNQDGTAMASSRPRYHSQNLLHKASVCFSSRLFVEYKEQSLVSRRNIVIFLLQRPTSMLVCDYGITQPAMVWKWNTAHAGDHSCLVSDTCVVLKWCWCTTTTKDTSITLNNVVAQNIAKTALNSSALWYSCFKQQQVCHHANNCAIKQTSMSFKQVVCRIMLSRRLDRRSSPAVLPHSMGISCSAPKQKWWCKSTYQLQMLSIAKSRLWLRVTHKL